MMGVLAIPWLLHHMGAERFGLLALAWAFTGYLTLLDFGLGRAMSQQVAKYANHADSEKITRLFWDAHITIAGFGLVGTLLILAVVPLAITHLPNINSDIHEETARALWFTALMVFPTLLLNSLNNFLLALEQFTWLNVLKVPLNTLNIAIPVWVTAYPDSQLFGILDTTCLYLLIGRSGFILVMFAVCAKVSPAIMQLTTFSYAYPKRLLTLGGWMTVTNIVGPMMTYFDRFFISVLLSPQAVATYTIAYELASKLSAIPNALTTTLAPVFAKDCDNQKDNIATIVKSIQWLSVIFIPVLLLMPMFITPLLQWWLGIDDVQVMAASVHWLAWGFYLNAIALVAYTYLQYIGRPDLTAKLHLLELPLYAFVLWLCLSTLGIKGAAIAWVIRAGIDMLFLLVTVYYLNRPLQQSHATL
ncbi:oligosaccharide flippase family protein [Thiothrix lacustris]|uniref:oligosaccharide flippase family protein n=1 Tax=Thiothrix lacustris TaxID=525917 RepID=UPI00048A9F94|nr:oligosaccharide flippase family protein [Thiothrix lacustris]